MNLINDIRLIISPLLGAKNQNEYFRFARLVTDGSRWNDKFRDPHHGGSWLKGFVGGHSVALTRTPEGNVLVSLNGNIVLAIRRDAFSRLTVTFGQEWESLCGVLA